ncbi:MAG TPA: hypothetical protein VM325_14955 [Alphaproteobacteria bacterium]|nr:hypothetical protein [Alphaproteobacteria bacterium]
MIRLSDVLTDRGRRIGKTILFVLFGLSVMANFALLTEVLVFSFNQPLYPICFTKADGFVVMRSSSRKFIQELATTLPDTRWHEYRKTAYVKTWYWRHEKNEIWNATRELAEYMHYKRTGERVTDANVWKLKTNSCPFIRKYASQ